MPAGIGEDERGPHRGCRRSRRPDQDCAVPGAAHRPRQPALRPPHPDVDWGNVPLAMPRHPSRPTAGGVTPACWPGSPPSGPPAPVRTSYCRHRRPRPACSPRAAGAMALGGTGACPPAPPPRWHSLTHSYAELLSAADAPRPGRGLRGRGGLPRSLRVPAGGHGLRLPRTWPRRCAGILDGEESPGVSVSREGCWSKPRLAFVFPGQGAQWAGMGKTLLATDRHVHRDTATVRRGDPPPWRLVAAARR